MSMLAERRRKTKWSLNPGRGALWRNDNSHGLKIGQGLMEKMGWKVGQGLGANEQGIKEPLKIAVKNDSKGMGFNDNENEWIQQQNEFNEILNKLSSCNDEAENRICENSKADRMKKSLEEKSRQSKTRVHYHKFTRGKDTTNYSEKDLECILGSRKNPSSEVSYKEKADSCLNLENDPMIIPAGSMVDYFNEKMQKKEKAKRSTSLDFDGEEPDGLIKESSHDGEAQVLNVVQKKKKKKKSREDKEKQSCKSESSQGLAYEKARVDEQLADLADNSENFIEDIERDGNEPGRNLNEINDCVEDSDIEISNGKSNIGKEQVNCVNTPTDNVKDEPLVKKKKKRRKERESEQVFEEHGFDCKNKKIKMYVTDADCDVNIGKSDAIENTATPVEEETRENEKSNEKHFFEAAGTGEKKRKKKESVMNDRGCDEKGDKCEKADHSNVEECSSYSEKEIRVTRRDTGLWKNGKTCVGGREQNGKNIVPNWCPTMKKFNGSNLLQLKGYGMVSSLNINV